MLFGPFARVLTVVFLALTLGLTLAAPAGAAARKNTSVKVSWGTSQVKIGTSTRIPVKIWPRTGRTVLLQERVGAGWRTVAKHQGVKGSTVFRVSHGKAGAHTYRVWVRATKWRKSAISAHRYSVTAVPPSNGDGILHGVSTGNSSPLSQEKALGRHLDLHRTFWRADQVDAAMRQAKTDAGAGRIPFMSFKLPYSWAEMRAGKGDVWARDLAAKTRDVPGQAWIALHHEPENDQPNIQDWTEMQRRMASIFDLPGVDFGLIVTGYHQVYGQSQYSLENIYPTGAPIDYLGFDIYQFYGSSVGNGGASNPSEYYPPLAAFAKKHNVAWGLGEYGITDKAWVDSRYNSYFDDLARDLPKYGASFACYFDFPGHSDGQWVLSGSKLNAWVKFVRATS